MPNMRIIHNNVADTATIIATSTAGTNYSVAGGTINGITTTALASVAYLQNDFKGQAYRTARTATANTPIQFTLSWASAVTIGGVALPCTNLSKDATIRVRLYTDLTTEGSLVLDSGTIAACTNTPLTNWTRFTTLPDVNGFPYGGLSKTAVWFSTQRSDIRRIKIDITDTKTSTIADNFDISRIVCGPYWQPSLNVSRQGLQFTVSDSTSNTRTDAGDLVSDQGFTNDQLSFNLELLTETDRNSLMEIIRSVGTSRNILVSVFPEGNNLQEQQYLIYGKRDNSAIDYVIAGYYSHSVSILGW